MYVVNRVDWDRDWVCNRVGNFDTIKCVIMESTSIMRSGQIEQTGGCDMDAEKGFIQTPKWDQIVQYNGEGQVF